MKTLIALSIILAAILFMGCSNHKEDFLEDASRIENKRVSIMTMKVGSHVFNVDELRKLKEEVMNLDPDWEQGRQIKYEITGAIDLGISMLDRSKSVDTSQGHASIIESLLLRDLKTSLLTSRRDRINRLIEKERELLR